MSEKEINQIYTDAKAEYGLDLKWKVTHRQYPYRRATQQYRRGNWNWSRILIHVDGMNLATVLPVLAHVLAQASIGRKHKHDKEFADCYAMLMNEYYV